MDNKSSFSYKNRNIPLMVWRVLVRPTLWKPALSLISTIWKDFFYVQFENVFGWVYRPVVHVDHPADELIPFTPSKVIDYVGFFPYWIGAPGTLASRVPKSKRTAVMKEIIVNYAAMYRIAGRIVRVIQSTTIRPKYKADLYFKIMHVADPHLNCVPSIHAMFVFYTQYVMEKLLKEASIPEELQDLYSKTVFEEGMDILDSILMVKQHSITCVGASIMLTRVLYPQWKGHEQVTAKLFSREVEKGVIAKESAETAEKEIAIIASRLYREWQEAIMDDSEESGAAFSRKTLLPAENSRETKKALQIIISYLQSFEAGFLYEPRLHKISPSVEPV